MNQTLSFKEEILIGIPDHLPDSKPLDPQISHAPKRRTPLSQEEKKLAVQNALRYFHPKHHSILAQEFADELREFGRIYMYRFRPSYRIYARPIHEYPFQSLQAAAIMVMLQNNLDPKVAQHPEELITYGGNGAVFQNWAQYLLTLKFLATLTDEQTLVLYSGHPLGLFPSRPDSPRVVITNGMVIPNYSKPEDWDRFNALGVSQYGQMTAGSFMYIGPQGIVHGTTITLLNAGRKLQSSNPGLSGKVFLSSGLGGMSGAQAKAASLAGAVGVIAEVNPKAVSKRHEQGWLDEVYSEIDPLLARMQKAKTNKEAVSLGYQGNVVDLWEACANREIEIEVGSDQTSLHNPWSGGYYPVDLSFSDAQKMMTQDPQEFKQRVQSSLRRQVNAINLLSKQGMYFFDYGNAFLLEAGRAKADIYNASGGYRYASYVEDIMGPICFDYGFGPFRWVCTSGLSADLAITDKIAQEVLEGLFERSPPEIRQQLSDNIHWIKTASQNRMVVGSQARILYADGEGRIQIGRAFNEAIRKGRISAPIVLGRDHHDVSGTDSPFRETSNIRDGSKFTADMAVHNFVGDAFRGATWISLHNGGGVGWGEVINGGFGLVLDGSQEADKKLASMLFWDVNNGLARRSWARNSGAIFSIQRAMTAEPLLQVVIPNQVDEKVIHGVSF